MMDGATDPIIIGDYAHFTAYDEGHAAALANEDISDNPYPDDQSMLQEAWAEGWNDALDELAGIDNAG